MSGTGGGAGSAAAHSVLKPLLPFSITPPRQNGPSEAERKIEALTRQLEEELEKEEESEYFGKSRTCGIIHPRMLRVLTYNVFRHH
jgi:LIM domain-containing protein